MKNNLVSVVRKSVAIFGLILTISIGTAFAQGENFGGGRLAGTWDAVVTITSCATGNALFPPFQSTANFNKGGTFTGITSGMPPAARSPEVGVWRHETGNSYRFRFKAYQFNSAGVAFRYQIVTHTVELAEDNTSYTSSGDVKFFAMNGTPDGAGCSTATATRMTLE